MSETTFGPATINGNRYSGYPVGGVITDRFRTLSEWRRINLGANSWHSGVDIAAAEGTPLLAPADGTFVWSGWTKHGLGYITILDHGDCGTLYAHQPATFTGLRYGERVRRGDRIGTVGNTGASTGPHLHWMCTTREVKDDDTDRDWDFTRAGGGLIDPFSIVKATVGKEPPKPRPVALTAEQRELVDYLNSPAGRALDAVSRRYYLRTVDLAAMPDESADSSPSHEEPKSAPSPAAATYTVRPGDVLHAIAQHHGVTAAQLAAWNGLADPNRIEVGQVLRLTAPAPPSTPTPKPPPVGTPAAKKAELDAMLDELLEENTRQLDRIVQVKQKLAAL